MTAEAAPLAEPLPEDRPGARGFELSRLIRASGYGAVVLALATTAGSFFILMGLTPIAPSPAGGFFRTAGQRRSGRLPDLRHCLEVVSLVLANRRGRAAARLHIRIVALFSLVAAVPAVLLAIAASVSLDRGLDNWFSVRTRAIVENSLSIAQAYAEQQSIQLRIDALAVRAELQKRRG